LLDGFKQVYPKIDAAYYRSNDAALMERFVSENRAGQNLCDVIVIKPAFAPAEVLDNFDRYAKLCQEIFGGR
jgi:hypothetical protein